MSFFQSTIFDYANQFFLLVRDLCTAVTKDEVDSFLMIETNKQTNKGTNKQRNKQTNKRTNTQTKFHSKIPDVILDKEILNTSTMPALLQTDDW
jgi:hypothetical protein